MKFSKKNRFASKAQAIAEFAIALPILLLVLYGLIETGRLLFIYSSVNNASRQAVRYGSTTGDNDFGDPRYMDCDGIRTTAQRADFLNAFDDSDIKISFDQGIDGSGNSINLVEFCTGSSPDTTINTHLNDGSRVQVEINAEFNALMPNIVPFFSRTFTAISSRTLLQTIEVQPELEDSTTSIDSISPSPSEIGETVTVVVTVSGPTLTPTGFVTVTADDGTACSATIELASGTGFCDMTFTTSGTKTISASYGGDNEYKPSGDSASHEVNKSPTTTTISADTPDPSQVNETVNVTVSVVGGLTPPTGTIDITGADSNCTITLTPADSGTGSCSVSFSSNGTKTLIATYNGDTDHGTSTDTEQHNVIEDRDTVTYITSDNPDASQVGQSVNVAVTVAGVTTPTGSVNVTTSDGQSCTITLSGGSGSCSITFTTVGAKTIFATYSGDADHDGSSDSEPHAVDLPATATTITAHTPNPSQVGQSVAVTVTVTGGASTPTGTVQITGASTNCTITLVSGTGSCNVAFNGTGSKTLSAAYSGDGSHAPSNGTVTHTVSNIPPIAGCDSSNIVTGFLQQSGNTMTMTITNNLTTAVAIGDITITWNHDKGHQVGSDKTLRLQSASIAGTTFWNGDQAGDTYTIAPTTTTFVPASATSTFVFTFHQSYDNKDGAESVTLTFSSPGCEGFTITQN